MRSRRYTIEVDSALIGAEITTLPVLSAIKDSLYTYQVAAAGYPRPNFLLQSPPIGMSINSVSGLIQWIPDTIGSFDVIVKAINQEEDTQTFSIEVVDTPFPPSISSRPNTTAFVGSEYTYRVTASGTPRPSFALVDGPGEMIINQGTGLISWTPEAVDTVSVTVRAFNEVGFDEQSFLLIVNNPTVVPQITSQAITNAVVGEEYRYQLMATGNPGPSFALTVSPSGMNIDSAGLIQWTPASSGNFGVEVEASNLEGADSQSFTITVTEALSLPSIISTPGQMGVVGELYRYEVLVVGNPTPEISLQVFPEGMTLTVNLIEWTPTEAGSYPVTVVAQNAVSSDTLMYTISVEELALPQFTIERSQPFGDPTLTSSYRLVSIPGNVNIALASTLDGSYPDDWKAFLDNGSESSDPDDYLVSFNESGAFFLQRRQRLLAAEQESVASEPAGS